MILGNHLHRKTRSNLWPRGHDNIGMVKKFMQLGDIGRIAEIERNTQLPCIVHRKGQRDSFAHGSVVTSRRTFRRFDLDDLSAQIAKKPWAQVPIDHSEINNAQPFERATTRSTPAFR